MEAKTEQRQRYLKEIAHLEKGDVVYIDESGIDSGDYKNRGWGKKGVVLRGKIRGKRFSRTNIIAGKCGKKILAPMTFKGSCNSNFFVEWVKQALVPELRPGQVVVMDNATFHKSPRVREIIEAAGCKLIYLPPYSPDLNPIEKFWAILKRWIKQNLPFMNDTHKAISFFFYNHAMSL